MSLKRFGADKIQPILLMVGSSKAAFKLSEKLMPLITIQDCDNCPLREHCASACVGFRNLYRKFHEGRRE